MASYKGNLYYFRKTLKEESVFPLFSHGAYRYKGQQAFTAIELHIWHFSHV